MKQPLPHTWGLGGKNHPAIKQRQILIRMALDTLILMWANTHFLLIYLRIYIIVVIEYVFKVMTLEQN